jgi:hypothetical protein
MPLPGRLAGPLAWRRIQARIASGLARARAYSGRLSPIHQRMVPLMSAGVTGWVPRMAASSSVMRARAVFSSALAAGSGRVSIAVVL